MVRRVILILLLGLSACLATCKSRQPKPLRIALRSILENLDPAHETTITAASVYINIFDGLVRRDHNLTIQPSLATTWSTPDDLTWIFELRKGVRFSDGTPLTASDVKFSLERVRDLNTQMSAAMAMLQHVEVLDGHRIRIVTTQPSSTLLTRLVDVLVVPAGTGPDRPLVGSGPYKVKAWQPGSFVHLEANDLYWGAAPEIQQVRFEAKTDPEQAGIEFLNNQIDILPQIDPFTIQQFGFEEKNIETLRNEGLMVLFLGFQTGTEQLSHSTVPGNPFRDRRVRLAVYHAINVNRLVQEIQQGYATPATQLVAPTVYGFDKDLDRYPYDRERAKALLKEAGYPNGFEVQLDTTNNRYRMDVEVGKEIAEDLNAVGIHVQLNQKPLQEWLEVRQKGESPFYLAGWACASGDASGALDYLFHTPDPARGYGSANSGAYSNPELDTLIEQCGRIMDPKLRLIRLQEAMRLAMNDVAAVPLYIEQNLSATQEGIRMDLFPDQIIRLEQIRKN